MSEVQDKRMGVTVFYKSCWGQTYAHCCAQQESGVAMLGGVHRVVRVWRGVASFDKS